MEGGGSAGTETTLNQGLKLLRSFGIASNASDTSCADSVENSRNFRLEEFELHVTSKPIYHGEWLLGSTSIIAAW
jgi:hypothetical protein